MYRAHGISWIKGFVWFVFVPPPLPSGVQTLKQNKHWTLDPINNLTPVYDSEATILGSVPYNARDIYEYKQIFYLPIIQGVKRIVCFLIHPFSRTYVDESDCPFTCWTRKVADMIFWKKILKYFFCQGQDQVQAQPGFQKNQIRAITCSAGERAAWFINICPRKGV